MLDIIGVGDASVDLIIKVDHLPGHDEKVRGKLLGKYPGGIIANFCCAASKFGAKTGIVTTVGEDSFGQTAIEGLDEFGVDRGGLVVKKGESTYFGVIYLDSTGEKALVVVETPILVPSVDDIDIDYLNRSRYVHLTSLDLELAKFVASSVNDDVKVSIDIEPTADSSGLTFWEDVLRKLDIVSLNEAGLRALVQTEDIHSGAKTLLEYGPEIVVVTSGASGVDLFTGDDHFHVPAFKVPVVDTTGAGDCFNAVFLSGLVKGLDLVEAANYANAAAALSIQHVGARAGLPTEADTRSFFSSKI